MPRLTKVSRAYSFCLVRPSVCLAVCPSVCPTFCRHYSSEAVRRSILIFIYVVPNILKFCTLISVFGRSVYWAKINVWTFSFIDVINTKSCRHYSSKSVRRSILNFIYVVSHILKLCTLLSVSLSVCLLGQNWRWNVGNVSCIDVVNTKSCRHYSSKSVRRSILIFIYVISHILELCILLSVCPFLRPKLTFELRQLFTSYLRQYVLAFSNALQRVIFLSENHVVSLTLRPGGVYVFRQDTFLVLVKIAWKPACYKRNKYTFRFRTKKFIALSWSNLGNSPFGFVHQVWPACIKLFRTEPSYSIPITCI